MSRDRRMHSSRRDENSHVPSVVMNDQSLLGTSSRRSKSYDVRRTTPWGTTKAKSWARRQSSADIRGLAREKPTSILRTSSPSRSKSIERSRKRNDCKLGQQDPIIQSTDNDPVHYCPRNSTKARSFTKSTSSTQLPPPPPPTRVGQGHVSSPHNSKPRATLPPPPPPPPRPPKPSTNEEEQPILTNATARAKGLKYVMKLQYSDKCGGGSGLYTGELDQWGRPSGQGFMKYENGKFYEGLWVNGVPNAVDFAAQNPTTPAAASGSSVVYAGSSSVTASMVYGGGGSIVAQPMMYVHPNMIPQGGYQYNNVMHQQIPQQQMQVPMIGHGVQQQHQGQQP